MKIFLRREILESVKKKNWSFENENVKEIFYENINFLVDNREGSPMPTGTAIHSFQYQVYHR